MALVPCPQCNRHARAGTCPFCGAEVRAPAAAPRVRSSRAALIALAAAAPVALADCRRDASVTDYGGPPTPLPAVVDAGEDAADAEPAGPASAAPAPADSASAAPVPTPTPTDTHTLAAPMYGMPPTPPPPHTAHVTAYGGPPRPRPKLGP